MSLSEVITIVLGSDWAAAGASTPKISSADTNKRSVMRVRSMACPL
jgi:hypothetical protein